MSNLNVGSGSGSDGRFGWKADIARNWLRQYPWTMDQATFVDLLRAVVLDGLSSDLARNWHHPPGRLRSEERSRRSKWLSRMSEADRALLDAFGSEAARSALFGVLAVLDGARKIEEPSSGHLELRHVHAGEARLLASSAPNASVLPLHELLP